MALQSDTNNLFTISHIQNPNRLFAVPVLGWLIKAVICIPQYIILFFLILGLLIVGYIVNSLYVLVTGKYLGIAYSITRAYLVLSTKLMVYFTGLSDRYPGFNLESTEDFTLNLPMPTSPSRLFAIPFWGGATRYLVMYGYTLFAGIMFGAAWIGMIISSVAVLLNGKYPESLYEVSHDAIRLNIGSMAYLTGLTDELPSTAISMNHKNVKILLFMLLSLPLVLMYLISFSSAALIGGSSKNYRSNYKYQYDDLNSSDSDSSNYMMPFTTPADSGY